MSDVLVSVVFPCLNEAGTIGECVRQAVAVLEAASLKGEVIVADNGSTDGSRELASKAGARVVPVSDKGYGNALYGGFTAARGRYIVHLDSDLSYPIEEIPDFVAELEKGSDLVMGTRLTPKMEPGAMPFLHRHLGTPVLTALANLFFKCGIDDVNCGMRGLTRDAFQKMDLRTGGMEFASEMVIKAALLGMNISQIPITFRKDKRGRPPHLDSFRDGWRHLRFQLLFAPAWLFLVPGLVSIAVGIGLIAAVVWGIDPRLGLASSLLGQSAISLGVLAVLFAIATHGFAHIKRLYAGAPLSRLFRWLELEKGIAIGTVLGISGLAVLLLAFYRIYLFMHTPGYRPELFDPSSTRLAIVGATLFITGAQTVFASFFLSLFKIETILARSPSVNVPEGDDEERG